MKEIFEHIYNENIERIAEGRVSFAFDYFNIVFELDDVDINDEILEKYSENPLVSEIDFSLFADNTVSDMFLRGYAYIEEYEIEVKGHYENEKSITYLLFEIVRNIKRNYPDAILNYSLGSLYMEGNLCDWMCPDYGWYYGFEIHIGRIKTFIIFS